MYKIATIVAYAVYVYYFKNAAIVAYAGLRVKAVVLDYFTRSVYDSSKESNNDDITISLACI